MYLKNLISFALNSIEYLDYKEHGQFTLTSLVIVIAFLSAFIQAWGIRKQNNLIWKNKSGESLPISFFVFQFIYFLSYLIYGIKINSAALVINNLVFILFIPIIVGLIKFRFKNWNVTKNELALLPLILLIIPCVILINTQWSLLAILFIAMLIYWNLLKQMQKSFKLNNIEPKYIYSVALSSFVWLLYGWKIGDFGIITSNIVNITAVIFLLLVFRKKFCNNGPESI